MTVEVALDIEIDHNFGRPRAGRENSKPVIYGMTFKGDVVNFSGDSVKSPGNKTTFALQMLL